MRNATRQPGILGDIFTKVFDTNGKIKEAFLYITATATDFYIPMWSGLNLVDSPIYSTGGLVGIGTTTLTEELTLSGGLSITSDPDSGDDVGDRDYNDTRYVRGDINYTKTGNLTMNGGSIYLEDGDHSITNNDGNGNFNIRVGHTIGENYTDNQGAIHMDFAHENTNPSFNLYVSEGNATAISGNSVNWLQHLVLSSDGNFKLNSQDIYHSGNDPYDTEAEIDAAVSNNGYLTGAGLITNYVQKWDGSNLINSALYSSGGNVGIGTTSPTEKLEVNGNIIADLPTANSHVATKEYVDSTVSAAGGGIPKIYTSSGTELGPYLGIDDSGTTIRFYYQDSSNGLATVRSEDFIDDIAPTTTTIYYTSSSCTTPSHKNSYLGDYKIGGRVYQITNTTVYYVPIGNYKKVNGGSCTPIVYGSDLGRRLVYYFTSVCGSGPCTFQ